MWSLRTCWSHQRISRTSVRTHSILHSKCLKPLPFSKAPAVEPEVFSGGSPLVKILESLWTQACRLWGVFVSLCLGGVRERADLSGSANILSSHGPQLFLSFIRLLFIHFNLNFLS